MNFIRRFVRRIYRSPKDELKEALKRQTGDTSLLFLTDCLTAFGKGDFKKAMKHVTEGLRENPDHPRLLLFKGMIFFKEYQYKEAVAAFRKTLEVDPNCKDAQDMLRCEELSIYAGMADHLRAT
jgi:uncharacterized protein HemY